eukprot:s6179_g3.t1
MECGRGVPAAGAKADFVPPCTAPTPTAPSPMPSPQIPSLEMRPDAESADVVVPLPVSLDQFYRGATRRVRVQAGQLKRVAKKLWQDVFDVKIPCGAPDGHRVTFKDKVCGGGDVVFVLQEMEHKTWARQGCNLFIQQSISLREALLGCELVIEHLDGRRLLVRSKPGAILVPSLANGEGTWSRFDDSDAFPGQDAGTAKTGDLESCKEICRRHGWAGFTYWEDKAYFRAQDRSMLLKHRRASRGSILFVRPQAKQMQHALLGYGMPQLGKPWLRGHLFVHLKVDLTDVGEKVAAALQGSGVTERFPCGWMADLEPFEPEEEASPAGRSAGCCCCKRGSQAPSGVRASADELFLLTNSIDWSQKKPIVTREVIIGDDSWEKGSLLQSVGYGENEIRLRGGRNADMMKKALQEPPFMLFFAV